MPIEREIDVTQEVMQSGIGAAMMRVAGWLEQEHRDTFGDTDKVRLAHEAELERSLALDDCIFSLRKVTLNEAYVLITLAVKLKGGVTTLKNYPSFELSINDNGNGFDLSEIFSDGEVGILRGLEKRLE